jgi:dTDP-4-amino-4,6-dideoxygalactose transaminase
MIFPRQILYGTELIKSYLTRFFENSEKINNGFHKTLGLKKNKKIIFTSKGRTALFLILKYLKIYKKKNEVIMSPFTIFDLVNIVIR